MKVHIIKRQTIQKFVERHAHGKRPFEHWLTTTINADWNRPEDIIKTFGTADLLGHTSDRVVFNVGGNNYRVIAKYYFGNQKMHLFIKWIGTHAEYDELCSHNRQFSVDDY